MKKLLMFVGGVFLLLLVVIVVAVVFLVPKGRALDRESRQFTDDVVPKIVLEWKQEELWKQASRGFKAAATKEDLNKLFLMFQRLGGLKEYKGASGEANISITIKNGIVITANYTAKADFDAGPATINIVLVERNESWQILGFRVDSKVFLQ